MRYTFPDYQILWSQRNRWNSCHSNNEIANIMLTTKQHFQSPIVPACAMFSHVQPFLSNMVATNCSSLCGTFSTVLWHPQHQQIWGTSNSSDCLSTKRKRLCRSSAVGVWSRRNGWKRCKVKGKQNGKEVNASNKIHDVVRKGLCWNESPKCYQFAVAVRFWLKFEKEHPNTSILQSFPLNTRKL